MLILIDFTMDLIHKKSIKINMVFPQIVYKLISSDLATCLT